MKAKALAEDILRGRPKTKKEAYGIEPCHSCGRTFTRNSEGSTSTQLARDGGQERVFCSDNCKDWYCDYRLIHGEIIRNPTFREQQAKIKEHPHGVESPHFAHDVDLMKKIKRREIAH